VLASTCTICRRIKTFTFAISSSDELLFNFFGYFNRRNAQKAGTASSCQISWRSVQPFLRYNVSSIFQDGGRPPSRICYARVRTTHEWHLTVFIAVQNLVVIDTMCSIMQVLLFRDLGSKRPIHDPEIRGGVGGLDPLNGKRSHRDTQKPPVVEICPFPLFWLLAFTTACTTVQVVKRAV